MKKTKINVALEVERLNRRVDGTICMMKFVYGVQVRQLEQAQRLLDAVRDVLNSHVFKIGIYTSIGQKKFRKVIAAIDDIRGPFFTEKQRKLPAMLRKLER